MKIIDKIIDKRNNLYAAKNPTIAFLGDSVTQGCFECYTVGENGLNTVFDPQSGYSNRLKEIFALLYPQVPVNFINAAINGDNTFGGLNRLQGDVIAHSPDLVIVSYGLNDSVQGKEGLENYAKNLSEIFNRISNSGAEVIFLTQNYMCTKTSPHLKDKLFIDLSKTFGEIQLSGVLDEYFEKAKEVCRERCVKVCDVRSSWEKMEKAGVDVTELLSNYLNHPIRDIHYYMAIKLAETIFE